jgi:hypothetical protein
MGSAHLMTFRGLRLAGAAEQCAEADKVREGVRGRGPCRLAQCSPDM